MNTSSLRKAFLVLGLAAVVSVPLASSARADDWEDHGGRGREQREHEWREHEWREHQMRDHEMREHYYAPPPVVYDRPAPGYYVMPPPVMAPPPGLNIVLPLNFR